MVLKPHGPPPLSRPFLVDDWRDDEASVKIVADERERAALAAAFGLPAIATLEADFTLFRRGSGRVEVRGEMAATVTQMCVVSLDPFETALLEPIDVVFAPQGNGQAAEGRPKASQEIHNSPLQEPPDPIVDGQIDLGVLAAEFLALGLDPYPHKPGVDFAVSVEDPPADSPFAALSRLKQQQGPSEE